MTFLSLCLLKLGNKEAHTLFNVSSDVPHSIVLELQCPTQRSTG